ncbi:UDP-N-acetylmuramoyl-L-alanine--D-glutamate ligase [Nostoc punctiforme]|uniref:UDP-N-acetylmuramoylalanine--D-glutamate ligase n=1 Tax=Nostoc punctiforme (strain ATCC 29133 / PCC 73102) TaxID=63737 RepID=MURD_NOSP7|nr:UDP-N-acetylmuramoyl-L-alanine--D-glutamate ligase [Nostoc punctiforme]B2J6I3.1 RecName: Full=UDP-N-acetylmuramoylalanine--D-glutamate ligase; AltName: Full=D-glutamic acid-adding enzyme; AltName: Full=UDP-N-acetylmuramoyl-L-alanyl-D-glutamate synthetase [Nostoc punctiforme PCC 73102]ACC82388.1 UDP-N-acetylmuramoylalanine--D-glutamate ligase [Nostoc punctiforme PCC 73102]
MSKAHVIGLGKSGVAAARLLKREGWEVELSDGNTSKTLLQQQQELAAEQITVKLGQSLELNGDNLPQLIVVSPGVPWDIPVLIKARQLGIETIGEMELAWRNLRWRSQPQASLPWVGITGTNGKTTTTALIAAIFQAAELDAPACGNIGYAACEVALSWSGRGAGGREQGAGGDREVNSSSSPSLDWVIAEVSSYQIESSSSLAPRIGVWTTFTPDHLSRHKTLENYYNIKAKLLRQSELQVFNGDDAYLSQLGLSAWPNAYWTSVKGKDFLISEKGFYIENGWVVEKLTATSAPEPIVKVSTLRMVGEHNQQNLLMAVATARLAGINRDAIARAIQEFPGVPHRLEHICTWEGIDFINDSKATNYDAAEVGLASVKSPAILIAGGEAKAGDDTGWLAQIQTKAAAVLLIGSAAPAFAQRLQEVGYYSYEIVETMERAVPRSAELAKEYQAPVVLLSPACASFDQYPNFEVRGDRFRELCLAWAAGGKLQHNLMLSSSL